MNAPREFHYRLPHRAGGWRPGAHASSSLGTGQEFISHTSLYNRPDVRRLDLRASLRDLRGDWLVRTYRQRVSIPIHVIADVSASMSFGSRQSKLQIAAEFVEALSSSAFRVGDSLGLLAFDAHERRDLYVPPTLSRGIGAVIGSKLVNATGVAGTVSGLEEVALELAGSQSMIFLVSDFHWPLDRLATVLDAFAHSFVVPIVIWDPVEIQPPAKNGLMTLRDMESGAERTQWVRPKWRARWREAVENRRRELETALSSHAIRPFYVSGAWDSEAMSRYFLEPSI
jgi:uncharacterized protein (DUF58 family)